MGCSYSLIRLLACCLVTVKTKQRPEAYLYWLLTWLVCLVQRKKPARWLLLAHRRLRTSKVLTRLMLWKPTARSKCLTHWAGIRQKHWTPRITNTWKRCWVVLLHSSMAPMAPTRLRPSRVQPTVAKMCSWPPWWASCPLHPRLWASRSRSVSKKRLYWSRLKPRLRRHWTLRQQLIVNWPNFIKRLRPGWSHRICSTVIGHRPLPMSRQKQKPSTGLSSHRSRTLMVLRISWDGLRPWAWRTVLYKARWWLPLHGTLRALEVWSWVSS